MGLSADSKDRNEMGQVDIVEFCENMTDAQAADILENTWLRIWPARCYSKTLTCLTYNTAICKAIAALRRTEEK